MFKCEICGKEFKKMWGLSTHIARLHKSEITVEEYYLKFIGEKGKCIECGKNTKFRGLSYGYNKFCSPVCSNNSIEVRNKIKQSNLEKTGYEYSMQNPETKEKSKQTCLENTGYEYPSQNPETRERQEETCLKNTGYRNPMQNPETRERAKQTNLEKTGYGYPMQNPETREKSKQTCLKKTGYENSGQDPKNKEKSKITNMKNLGVEYSSQVPENRKKAKETYMKKTGYYHSMQNPESREKSKITNLKNLGVEYTFQSPIVKEKSINTCMKNFNVKNPSQNKEISKKQQESLVRNNGGIHPKKLTYKKCLEKYPDVVKIEKLIEGPNGEILGHCKNSNCKNSEENGGYFDVSKKVRQRNIGINGYDTDYLYCCEECKHSCPLYGKRASELHNLINENKEIPYTQAEYSTWREEVYHRQRIENDTDTNFCEYCQATENLQAHHIHPQKLEPGYSLDPINGIIFCEKCHYEIGHAAGTECSTGNLANKICK
jgi:hypothetical protein